MSTFFSFFYIYDPWFWHVFRTGFAVGVIALVWLVFRLYKRSENGIFLPIDSLAVWGALLLIAVIPVIAHGSGDLTTLKMYPKGFMLFVLGIVIYHLCYRKENAQARLVCDLQIGIGVQAFVGFFALAGVPFMIDFALASNAVFPKFYGSEQEYRLYNFTSSGFFQLSIFYLMLLHFLLAYNQKHNNISSIWLFLLLFIGLISGRTFLMFSVVSILIYFKWRYLPALLAFLGMCIFFATQFTQHPYVEHALEPLINLIYGKGTLSSSTDTLMQRHLFIPELKQILVGDGFYFYPQGGYYGGTDSGFLRQLLFGGIGYLIACFLFTAYFVRRIAQNWFDDSWKFTLSTLALLSILNVKADTYAYPAAMMGLLCFLSLFGQAGKNRLIFAK
ncbi:MAG: hypothetical protein Q4B95_09460 [Lonepinella koalarum]|nr:hypothetical protein [Lonepinella koalarum]